MFKKIVGTIIVTCLLSIGLVSTGSQANSDGSYLAPSLPGTGDWYVTPGGSDENACDTIALPCATINMVLTKPGFVDGDTVLVSSGIYSSTVGTEVVLLSKSVILSGGWDEAFTNASGRSTLDGQGIMRVVLINAGVTASMDRFVIQNGFIFDDNGSGIRNLGELTLTNSSVHDNQAGRVNEPGGGAGIYNAGILVVEKSSIHHNLIYNQYHTDGGGIYNYGGSVTLNQSSVTDNFASEYGGGIYNSNGGTLVVNNSTISGNQATAEHGGGGIHNGLPSGAIAFINSSTVSNNIGVGIVTYSDTITLQNTILAGNRTYDGLSPWDCYGQINSEGYNLVSDTTSCVFVINNGDLLNENPHLFSLVGDPAYQPVLSDSPAIDAGNPLGCTDQLGSPLLTDQRGIPRYGRCDIGAYEYDPAFDPTHRNFLCLVNRPCLPIFYDDFSDPSTGWPVVDTGNIRLEYLDNEYRMLLRNPYWWVTVDSGVTMRWFEATVDVRNIYDTFASYGIIFEIDYDLGEFMSLEIYPDGWYGIYHYYSYDIVPVVEGYSSALHQGSATNHISFRLSDPTRMQVYANGQLLTDFMYNGLIWGGSIGLIAFNYDEPNLDLRFDNFTVDSIQCSYLEPNSSLQRGLPSFIDQPFLLAGGFENYPMKHQP